MAIAAVQSIINSYTMQEADLGLEMTNIMMSITLASRKTAALAQSTTEKKQAVKSEYDSNDDTYKAQMSDIQDEYDMKLAEIQSWETELETKKENIKTQMEVISNYKENYKSLQKKNVQNDFKYGGNQ